jgi:phospholipase/lecithinase/hemolysin
MAQINDYLISKDFNLTCVADATQYIFWGGGNDIIFSPISNDTLTDNGVKGQLANVEGSLPWLVSWQVGKLLNAGAKNILVMLLEPWSRSPLLQTYSAKQRQALDEFTLRVNKYIQGNITATPHAAVNLQFFDTFQLMETIFQFPEAYGLVNITAPCLANWEIFIQGIGGQAQTCSNPDSYVFWDGYGHPTTKVHEIIAKDVMKSINWEG